MRHRWFTCVRLSDPYLTVLIPPFNHIVHDLAVTNSAACGSLKSAPVGRFRWTYHHLRYSIALSRFPGTLQEAPERKTLRTFLLNHIEPGSLLLTDGLSSYAGAIGSDYLQQSFPVKGSGKQAHELLPGVHRVASLVKRWLLGTHQGAVEVDHMQAYLDEFTFRFNRRSSRARGMLFYRLLQRALEKGPLPFQALVVNHKPRKSGQPSNPPLSRHTAPPSLRVQTPANPWRR